MFKLFIMFIFKKNSQSIRAKVIRQEGNSPDYLLRFKSIY